MERKKIAIVGGGITGLSAAYYLQKQIKASQLAVEVQLVEASDRLGGRIHTIKKDGFTIERGPDSLLARKPEAMGLAKELGLEEEIVYNGTGQSYILVKNKLHKMPKGAFMGVPKELKPLLASNVFSLKGKLRALWDLVLPKSKEIDDQSVGTLMRHRFGNELVDYQIDPLLSGIHSGDIDQMSLQATYPMFHRLEQEHGSLIKGLQKTMSKPTKKAKEKKTQGMFFSFENGLETLIERLEEKLADGTVRMNTAVDHIEKKEHGYHLLLSNGEVYRADAVIMTAPHNKVPKMLSQYDFLKKLYDIPATSTANVVLGFDQSAIKKDIDGTGFLVSRSEKYRITACTWTHRKWPNTTPEGKALFRLYVGKPDDQDIVNLSDEEITDIVLRDMNKTMKIKAKPEFSIITRFKEARPQYHVGHLERVAEIRANAARELPGLFLTGSSYDGVGIPDCIGHGRNSAEEVLAFLNK
ncbi:protoporphyrinogen oxidase [Oceanobacillus polygoni]|uniref:Coproporphyrinogen III oxidase n=1 Tax=Oceanobacillus polygoni TaxID=1235259 RepID=A0A9X0YPM7_9BACI|nr:protoporphyrinogen oxidase [Oceanobacillus polygoni]MBP2076635.1 oxygen-dependent protoporphyrinogen oxidase [Oceanobacillus polygoni]